MLKEVLNGVCAVAKRMPERVIEDKAGATRGKKMIEVIDSVSVEPPKILRSQFLSLTGKY